MTEAVGGGGQKEEVLRDLLPANYEYKVVKFEMTEFEEDNIHFTAELRVNCESEGEVKVFLSTLNMSTGCTFNIASGRQDKRQDSGRCKFRGYRKCSLNINKTGDKPDRQPGKNTACPASVNFRLEKPVASEKSVKTDRMKYPLWIKLCFVHNHSLNLADYLKFLSVNEETRNVYWTMIEEGLLPRSAHIERRKSIKIDYPDTWPQIFADRSRLPSLFWVYKLHRQFLDSQIGSRDEVDVFEKSQQLIKQFDKDCQEQNPLPDGKYYAKISQTEDGETCVVICDPFMQRVHATVPQSGELVLIDATSNLDRCDSKLIHIVCPTPIGSLPLADIVVTREDTKTLKFAFELLEYVLPDQAFYGRGHSKGPQCVMTDDCDAERIALAETWPDAVLLLCVFHVLQAIWTWLWDGKHQIEHKDRQTLLIMFRYVLYAETEGELSERLEELYADETVLKYPQFYHHLLKHTFPKMQAWSVQRRISERLPTSSNNTNNLVESSFRYVKDIMFNRLRVFNLTEMLSLVLDRSEWYVNKVIDAANDRIQSWLKNCNSRYVMKLPNIDPDTIVQMNAHVYLVPSESDTDLSYVVDMETRRCTCFQGRLAGPCKHKYLVAHTKNVASFDVIPTNSPRMRQIYMYLGTGKHTPLSWFLDKQASLFGENDGTSPADENVPVDENVPADENVQAGEDGAIENRMEDRYLEDEMTDAQELKEKLKNTLKVLSDKLCGRIDSDLVGYAKAISTFEKTVNKLPTKSDAALQKSLCSFGKSVTQVHINILI